MLRLVKTSVAVAALTGAGLFTPAMAQSASEMAVRIQQLEEQVRQLSGQVEELSFQVKQMKGQGGAMKSGALQTPAQQPQLQQQAGTQRLQGGSQPQPSQQKRLAAASAGAPLADDNSVDVIDQQPLQPAAPAEAQVQEGTGNLPAPSNTAPGFKVLGGADNAAAHPNDGGFQGKVLVPPSQQEPGDDAYIQQQQASIAGQQLDPGMGADAAGNGADSIENVSLAPESPEALYERSNESLLRRQFGDAEAGFSNFLQKYPDHSLAGSAQYWLGETYFAQSQFKSAAQSFLQGYKKYPNSRRAPDSLLKLGISLGRLGQTDQACAAYAAVNAEYPKAVEARKRAQAEAKRAGCSS